MTEFWAVVPAAGVGKRMGASLPKQYLPLAGKTIIEHTLSGLLSHPRLSGVVVATSADDGYWSDISLPHDIPLIRVEGGAERCQSVLSGLSWLMSQGKQQAWALVHDAARPCLRHEDIDNLMDQIAGHEVGGLLGLPVSDTIKFCDGEGTVQKTVDRSGLWRALTPQMFRVEQLESAIRSALSRGQIVTDEASAIELAGLKPKMIEGHSDNIKVTRPQDLVWAELYLKHQGQV